MKEVDFKFKIIIAGIASVGKTSLIRRYVDNIFEESYIATMLTDWSRKDIHYKGKNIRLNIIELGGQERFRLMQQRNFKLVDYICVVASVDQNERKSLTALPTIINFVLEAFKKENPDNNFVPLIIVLNKLDLITGDIHQDAVLYKFKITVKKLIKGLPNHGILFTSAKTGEGVDVLFNKISTELLKTHQ